MTMTLRIFSLLMTYNKIYDYPIRIETRQAAALRGSRIVVAVDSWPRHSRYPHGHFVRVLGKIGTVHLGSFTYTNKKLTRFMNR